MGDLSSFLLSPCSLYIRRNGALRHRAVGENRPGLQAHTGADVGGVPRRCVERLAGPHGFRRARVFGRQRLP